jgi:hypothetical protein
LVFQEESLFNRLLHNQTAFTLEQRLQFEGIQMIVLPIRVFGANTPPIQGPIETMPMADR